MTNLETYQVVRELLAEGLLVLNLYLFWSFAANISILDIKEWRHYRDDQTESAQRVRGAAALATYFLGAMALRGWDAALFFSTNMSADYDYPPAETLLWMVRNSWMLLIVFGAIIMIGGLCIVRVFNRRKRSNLILSAVAFLSLILPPLFFLSVHGYFGRLT